MRILSKDDEILTEIAREYQSIFRYFLVQSVALWHISACWSFFISLLILTTIFDLLNLSTSESLLLNYKLSWEKQKNVEKVIYCLVLNTNIKLLPFFYLIIIIVEEDVSLYVHIISTTSCILRWWPALWFFLVILPWWGIFTRFTAFWIYPSFLQYPAENLFHHFNQKDLPRVILETRSLEFYSIRSEIYFIITYVLKKFGSRLMSTLFFEYI